MTMDRAHFLRLMALGSLGISLAPAAFLRALATSSPQRKLVLIELQGGNDGLNTLIPFTDSRYYQLRPKLAIPKEKVLPLSKNQGVHPAMASLLPYWKKGQWAWINGVGYPNPNRSHFRSIEIWETASTGYRRQGWLEAPLKQRKDRAQFPLDGVLARADTSGPFAGQALSVLSTADVFRFSRQRGPAAPRAQTSSGNNALAHIQQLTRQKQQLQRQVFDHMQQQTQRFKTWRSGFPRTPIGRELADVACCILTELPAPVYKVTLKGFDTHRGQARTHWRLLKDLSEALSAFAHLLETEKQWDQTLVMSYSEFGRRPAENGSGGTDHGTAAPHFVLGGRVAGGLYGSVPDLKPIQHTRDNLNYAVDFRQLYRTVIEHWWQQSVPSEYAAYESLSFIR